MPSTSGPQDNALQAARDAANISGQYCSATTRADLVTSFKAVFNGLEPYSWQLDITEAILLGLDCVAIAGTGSGKTMPFIMPLLVDHTKKKMVIVVSPLNDLEEDQARRFKQIGLTATAVNGALWNNVLQEEIINAKHRVILTSPEMCLYHPPFSKLMRSADFTKNVCMIAIDEAHCISQWGDGFRKAFGELGRLRSCVPTSVPFLATSATLPPLVLSDIQTRLHFARTDTYYVNLGNHRANITNILVPMRTATDLGSLNFLVDEAHTGQPLRRTIVFFNTRDLTFKGSQYLKKLLPEVRQQEIDFLHAGRTNRARRFVLNEFRKGNINILCATEAAGMGMDICDIDLVVQFMVATSLSTLTQRFGRAGRSGQPALAVLLAEPSVFQVKKKKNVSGITRSVADSQDVKEEPADDNDLVPDTLGLDDADAITEYKKKTEAGLQDWCMAPGCRLDISDKYFNNPPRPTGATPTLCCDNCLRSRQNNPEVILTEPELRILAFMDRLRRPSASQAIIDIDALNISAENTKRPGQRRGERLQSLRSAIIDWRSLTWSQNYSDCAWGPSTLLPDAIITKLATRSHIDTLEDIKQEFPEWDFVDDYGSTVLELIQTTDNIWKEEHSQQLQNKKELRKRRSIENKEQREEERRTKKRAETVQRNIAKTTWSNTFAHPAASQSSPWPAQPFFPHPSTSSLIPSQPAYPQQSQFYPQQSQFYPQQSQFYPQQSQFYPQQSQFYPQQSQFYPQPIFFVPGPGSPQIQRQAEFRALSDLPVTQNQPQEHEM